MRIRLFRHRLFLAGIFGAGLVGFASPAQAIEIYFNGVKVWGLRNQVYKNCTARFDARGNLYLTAPGYKVTPAKGTRLTKAPPPASKGQAMPRPTTKRYFLVSTGNKTRRAQYDIDVYLNGKWIRKIRGTEGQVVVDISKKLLTGPNQIQFAATKNYNGSPRLSASPAHFIRVIIGQGSSGGGTVNITRTLADFRASAAKTKNFGSQQRIDVE